MSELRFIVRNQKRILQQKVAVESNMNLPNSVQIHQWQDVPLIEEESTCATRES